MFIELSQSGATVSHGWDGLRFLCALWPEGTKSHMRSHRLGRQKKTPCTTTKCFKLEKGCWTMEIHSLRILLFPYKLNVSFQNIFTLSPHLRKNVLHPLGVFLMLSGWNLSFYWAVMHHHISWTEHWREISVPTGSSTRLVWSAPLLRWGTVLQTARVSTL